MHWIKQYRKALLAGDIGAGVIVALMMIPQGMAYALVAGLPPVTGLYASLLPAVAYALFGSSMVQSVGPMAITSLMLGTSVAALAPAGSALYLQLSQQLRGDGPPLLIPVSVALLGSDGPVQVRR